jgi:hypothetical protein
MARVSFTVVVADHTLDYREDLRQFPAVELEVDEGDLLLDISNLALQRLDLRWEHSFTSFITPSRRGWQATPRKLLDGIRG